jgi:hypothetical protein
MKIPRINLICLFDFSQGDIAFTMIAADSFHLNAFTRYARAKKCYEGIGFAERHTDADVFAYKDELWSRCNMIIKKE